MIPLEPDHRPRAEALLAIGLREQERFAAACDPPGGDGFFEAEMAEHRHGLATRPEEWRVALDEADRVVGALWLTARSDHLGPYATVRQIVVHPAHRRRGVGTHLLRHAEAEATVSGAGRLVISALRPNPAWRLYRSLGFSDLPDEHREDLNPEHVVLWKWLPVDPGPAERG